MSATLALAGREWRQTLRQPGPLVFTILQPVLFLGILSAVFGQVLVLPSGVARYADHLAPAMAVFAAAGAGMTSGMGLVEDRRNGMLDRVRAGAGSGLVPLTARILADCARTLVAVAAVVLVGVAAGARPAGPVAVVAVLAGAVLVGTAWSWLWLALGVRLDAADALQAIGNLVVFVLLFLSASLAPIGSFPGWLQPIVRVNPLTVASAALRDLAAGAYLTPDVGRLVLAVLAAWVVLGWWAIRGWARLARV